MTMQAICSSLRTNRKRKKKRKMQWKKLKKLCKIRLLMTIHRTILSWNKAKKFKRMTNWLLVSNSLPLWSKVQDQVPDLEIIVPYSKACHLGTVLCLVIQRQGMNRFSRDSNFTKFLSQVPLNYQMSISTMLTQQIQKVAKKDLHANENRSSVNQNCRKLSMKYQRVKFLQITGQKNNKISTGTRTHRNKIKSWDRLHQLQISGNYLPNGIINSRLAKNLQKCIHWSSHPRQASDQPTMIRK